MVGSSLRHAPADGTRPGRGGRGRRAAARVASVAALVSILASASPARADPTPADRAMAQTLFDEGRRLMAEHRYADACPKLAESQRLDPGVGTLLNLAVCHEGQGKLASAWEEFKEGAGEARREGQTDREKLASDRAARLAPRLSRLTVTTASGASVSALVVNVDGETLGRAAWGVAMPIDPGRHSVTASAPGYRDWSTSVDVASERDSRVVRIPALDPAQAEAPAATSPAPAVASAERSTGSEAPSRRGASPLRIVGLATGGVGAAGLVVGGVFGLMTSFASGQQKSDCASAADCTNRAQAISDHSTMETDGTIADVAFIAGGALLAAGVALYLIGGRTSSEEAAASLVVSPMAVPAGGGAGIGGRF